MKKIRWTLYLPDIYLHRWWGFAVASKTKKLKYLLLPDKFKNSLTSQEVIDTLRRGIQNVDTRPIIKSVQVSDGGDGFLEAIYATGDYLWEQLESVNAGIFPSAIFSDS